MAGWWWTRSAAIFRWPEAVGSYILGGGRSSWDRQSILRDWETLTVSIVDDVVWKLITAVESVALVSMFCFFFLFCGCTV